MIEEWKPARNFPLYEVSNLGNVRNVKTGLNLALPTSHGYVRILVCNNGTRKNKMVHRLVMEAFVGEPPQSNSVIHHINGIKTDNRLVNLMYCTQSHNICEDFKSGRRSYLGEKNNSAKLKASDIPIIKEYRKLGMKYKDIVERFDISMMGIANIFNGHTWAHIQ